MEGIINNPSVPFSAKKDFKFYLSGGVTGWELDGVTGYDQDGQAVAGFTGTLSGPF